MLHGMKDIQSVKSAWSMLHSELNPSLCVGGEHNFTYFIRDIRLKSGISYLSPSLKILSKTQIGVFLISGFLLHRL